MRWAHDMTGEELREALQEELNRRESPYLWKVTYHLTWSDPTHHNGMFWFSVKDPRSNVVKQRDYTHETVNLMGVERTVDEVHDLLTADIKADKP
jgi:hypothetical protein